MDEGLCIVHTRNRMPETVYHIQETKTIFKTFFTLILKRNRYVQWFSSFLREKDKLATGKRQIRLSSDVSNANTKLLEQLESFYSGKN